MNCSQTEQISRHLPTGSTNDANFMRSTREEEFSLNQAASIGGGHESCEIHTIHAGSSITT